MVVGFEEKLGDKFSRWFDKVIEDAEVYDYGRYPVKGCGVWRPYGFKIRERVLKVMRELLDSTGHEEILLPLLVPQHLLSKEAEHIKGFEGEVYWVTHGGTTPLDVKLALRPTSETVLSLYESYWLKSYKQLPAKYYQVVSVFRYETKATKPMIRVREVTTFKEAHTAHASFEDAERQVLEAVEIYRKFFDTLLIPYIISKRPDWDKFAGALYTIAFDTIMPDGKTLQIGTVHLLGQSFAKAFEVRVQLEDESIDYVWQTSYGISERVVAALIAIHGDNRGLVLPPGIAPIDVVIIPIYRKEDREKVLSYAYAIRDRLKARGLTVKVDDREDITPGSKFYYWEARGVPVRVDVGVREVESNSVTLVRRDTLSKTTVSLEDLEEKLTKLFDDIRSELRARAWRWLEGKIRRVESVEEAREIIATDRGVVELPWCGRAKCGVAMEGLTEAKALGTPLKPLDVDGKCPICGANARTFMRYAKTY